jgi:hypothetical protein
MRLNDRDLARTSRSPQPTRHEQFEIGNLISRPEEFAGGFVDFLPGIVELIARLSPQRCPHCRKWICSEKQRE